MTNTEYKSDEYKNFVSVVVSGVNSMPGRRSDLIRVFASTAFLDRFKRGNRYPTGIMGVKIIPVVSDKIFTA